MIRFPRDDHRNRLAEASRCMQFVESKNLTLRNIQSSFWHKAKSSLKFSKQTFKMVISNFFFDKILIYALPEDYQKGIG